MANEFRVKNGLIIDEANSGAGVLTIADSNISSDDGSIEVTVVDGQTVTLGKTGSHANIVVAPHGTAGSEKITALNTSGTDDEAILLDAAAGGITLRADASGKRVHFHTPIIDTTQQATNMMVINSNTTAFKISDSGNNAFITVDTSNNAVHFGNNIDLTIHDGGILAPNSEQAKGVHFQSTGGISVGSSTYVGGGTGLQVNAINADDDYVEARLRIGVAEGSIGDTLHDEDLGFLVIQNASYTGGGSGGSMGMVVTGGASGGAGYTWGWGTARDSTNTFVLGHMPGKPFDDVRGTNDSPFEITAASDAGELMKITATGTHTTQLGAFVGSSATAGDHIWQNGSLATPHDLMRLDAPAGAGAAELKLYEGAASSNNYVGLKAGTMGSDVTFTLPTADGSNGQVLQTNGSGVLSFTNAASGGAGQLNELSDVSYSSGDLEITSLDKIISGDLTFDSSGDITLSVDGDNVKIDDGTDECFRFTTTSIKHFTIFSDTSGGNNDYFNVGVTTNGATTISTVDDAGANANLTFSVDGDISMTPAGGDFTVTSAAATFTSASASQPVVHITNTHDGSSSGELRFNKDSASGGDNDVMGKISFYGTDDSDNAHEQLAYMEARITEATHGSEAAEIRFFVAENDGTLTQGLSIAGQASDDGEVDVTIGAGAGSTTTIAGNLTVNGTTTTVNSTTVTIDDLNFNIAADVTASSSLDGAGIVLGAATYASGSSFSNNPSLLYDHSGTRWEFSAHDVEVRSTTASSSTTTGALIVGGGIGLAEDIYVGADAYIADDLSLTSDGGIINIGADNDLQLTHDGSNGTITNGTGNLTLDVTGEITLDADGDNINLKAGSTAFGSLTNSSGDLQVKAASGKGIELRSNTDMEFVIEDDAGTVQSTFLFHTESTAGTDLTGVDNEAAPVTMVYKSASTELGRTEFGKVQQAGSGTTNQIFQFASGTFSVAEVTLHATDGATQQANKMIICADPTGTDQVAFSNYSEVYSDGSTKLVDYAVAISSDTVTLSFDGDDDDTVTYAVTFLA